MAQHKALCAKGIIVNQDQQDFIYGVQQRDHEIERTAAELAEARRDKDAFVQQAGSKLLGIKPGDEVYVFPSQPFPRHTMRVERIEYWGKSPDGELSFSLNGKQILQSGGLGKRVCGTSVFPLSHANTYKTRND